MTSLSNRASPWLFSKRLDLGVFTAPALVALLLLAIFPQLRAAGHSPSWLWLVGILLVDVAHVWSTIFITYFDPQQLRQHPLRYVLVPLLSWALGWVAFRTGGAPFFWTALAYLAVFHFVRQQAGWLGLYRRRFGETSKGQWLDQAAIYAATLYPLLWWHTHLPRNFVWFLPGDFQTGLPKSLSQWGLPVYLLCLATYAGKALYTARQGQAIPWGKHLLLLTTALTWYWGIIGTNSDAAFTLTNVFTHGLPYAALVFSYGRRTRRSHKGLGPRLLSGSWHTAALRFVTCLWLFSYVEELCWNTFIWNDEQPIFQWLAHSVSPEIDDWHKQWLVPLLAVPQLSHYLLDGIFWKKRYNSELKPWLTSLP